LGTSWYVSYFNSLELAIRGKAILMIVIIAPNDRKVFGSKIFTTQTWVSPSPAKMKNDYILSECLLENGLQKSSVRGWLMTHDIFSCWCGHVNMLFCSFFQSQDQRWVLEKVSKFQ
jgi:hypothetical protein